MQSLDCAGTRGGGGGIPALGKVGRRSQEPGKKRKNNSSSTRPRGFLKDIGGGEATLRKGSAQNIYQSTLSSTALDLNDIQYGTVQNCTIQ